MASSFSFDKSYGAKVETARPVKTTETLKEGFTATELVNLYKSMTEQDNGAKDHDKLRKYDMSGAVSYSRYSPEYIPNMADKLLSDSDQVIHQQMVTMGFTLAATASLAIIVFMVTTTASSSQ